MKVSEFMNKPCQHCPYRSDVRPFLHPSRGEELAYAAQNPYNSFPCHKTLEYNDDGESYGGQSSKMCAGFLSLMHNELGETPYDEDGFTPSDNCYQDSYDMAAAYEGDS